MSLKTVSQVSIALISCTCALLILESKGLVIWVNRLEPSILKTVAQPIVYKVEEITEPLGIPQYRQKWVGLVHQESDGDEQVSEVRPIDTHNLQESKQKTSTQIMNDNDTTTTQNVEQTTSDLENTVVAGMEQNSKVAEETEKSDQVNTTTANVVRVSQTDFATTPVPLKSHMSEQLKQLNQKEKITVVLTGDSMMGVGLSASIQQRFSKNPQFEFIKAFKPATGLARPEVFDWLSEYPKMLNQQQPDLVVVAIGANDAQDIMYQGKILQYGSKEWFDVYETRMRSYLEMLSANNTQVIWLSLPKMRSETFDKRMDLMNRFTYQLVQQYTHASWFNTNIALAPSGEFTEYAQDTQGKTIKSRANDGKHMTYDGSKIVTELLFEWYQPSP